MVRLALILIAPWFLLAAHAPLEPVVDPDPELDTVEIEEWQVSWEPTGIADWPRDPYVGPDGKVWFAGQRGHFIGQFDPATEEFQRWSLESGTEPHNVILDSDGYPWYAGLSGDHIGRLDPATGDVRTYAAPEGVQGAHTQVWDADGNMWFTAYRSSHVVKFDVSTGEMQEIHVDAGTGPYGLKLDPQGRPWFTTMGANVGMIDPATMEATVYDTPDGDTRTRRLAITSDGRIWWGDYQGGYFGVLDPESGEMRQWMTPGGQEGGGLYAMVADDQDRVWYFETRAIPNRLIGFDPQTEEFFSITDVPSGGGTVRHIVYHEADHAIWFATDRQTVGRATLPR